MSLENRLSQNEKDIAVLQYGFEELGKNVDRLVENQNRHLENEREVWQGVVNEIRQNKSLLDQFSPLFKWALKAIGYILLFLLNAILIILFLNGAEIINFS